MAERLASFYETKAWKDGDEGQRFIASWLRRRGYWIVPSYDYSGPDGDKAPRMFGPGPPLVLPDLDVARKGERFWVEVKTKGEPTLYRKTQTLEHGFARRHFDHYLQIQQITGCRVFVLFYEKGTGRILGHWLDRLAERKRESVSQVMGSMVFFPIDTMKVVGSRDFADDLA